MVNFIKMNESHPCDACLSFHCRISSGGSSGAQLSPCPTWQDLSLEVTLKRGDGSSQSRCKNVLLPWQNCCSMTQLHCLSAAQGAMYPAECTVINHVGKNKRGEWREQGSGGQQPQCFLNNTRLKFTDMMKGRRWRRCRGGLLVSCCDLGLKHNPASAL